MPPLDKPLDVLGTYQDPLNLDQGAGKLVNVRAVARQPTEGKPGKVRLIGSPGLTLTSHPTFSPCIAICHALGTIWSAHADGTIFRGVESSGLSFAGVAAVNPANPVIRLAEDRTALVITSNANVLNPALAGTAYIATLFSFTNAGFDTSINFDPSACTELDNMALYSGASNFYSNQNSKMYRSNVLNPGSVGPTFFATKEARADRVVDLALSGHVMWPLGSRTMEQWYDAGNGTDFPFTPFPNSLIEVGLAVRATLAQLRGNIGFVGTDKRIWICNGQSGQGVSPQWIDLLLQQLPSSDFARLTAYAYGQGGSDFYVLTLPGSWSLEVSLSTGIWSYRASPGRLDHAGRCATEHDGGVTYVGLDTGEICVLDLTNVSELASPLTRTIITPWVGSQVTRHVLEWLNITSSMGPAAGQIQLDWSEDGGVTWRGLRNLTLPEPGEQRTIARAMGTSRRRQLRIRYSGDVAPFEIDELFASISVGT